jgi:phenylacetate-coenzyme A ligase PaaK-like adenylate-forming protein
MSGALAIETANETETAREVVSGDTLVARTFVDTLNEDEDIIALVVTAGFFAKQSESWHTVQATQTVSEKLNIVRRPLNEDATIAKVSQMMNDLREKAIAQFLVMSAPYTDKFAKLTFGTVVYRDTIICDVVLTSERVDKA